MSLFSVRVDYCVCQRSGQEAQYLKCEYDDEQGYCYDVGQTPGTTGVCQGESMATADCEHGEPGCVTEYGVSQNTVCFEFVSGTYCMELCTPAEVICDAQHRCVPLVGQGGLGVCVPFV